MLYFLATIYWSHLASQEKKTSHVIFLFPCFITSTVISKCGTLIMLIFRTVSSFGKEMWTLKLAQLGIPLPGQFHCQWKWVLFCLQIKNKKVVSSIIPKMLFTLIYQLLPRTYRVQEHYSTVRTHLGLSYWKNYSWHEELLEMSWGELQTMGCIT